MPVKMVTITNGDIECALPILDELRKSSGELGYIAAWNYRKLSDAVKDYMTEKAGIISDHGIHRDGETVIPFGSSAFGELLELANQPVKVDVYTLEAAPYIERLPGEAIITLDFMFDGAWSFGLE